MGPRGDAMDRAFAAANEAPEHVSSDGEIAQGLPSAFMNKPGWVLPLIVGVLALVVGGAVTLVVMMR
jgi:hypothetical protein